MTEKRYPFNLVKNAVDLEFRRNRAMNERGDKCFNNTLTDLEDKQYSDLIDNLAKILLHFPDNKGIIWLTGKEYGWAQESVAWATAMRAHI